MRPMSMLAVVLSAFSLLQVPLDATLAAAQSKPDLSGTWKLDRSKSKVDGGGNGSAYISSGLVISHREPEFKVTRKFVSRGREQSEELTYYTDGRGENNAVAFGIKPLATKTKWDGSKLVTKWTWQSDVANDTLFTDVREGRELSQDGRILTVSYSISGIGGLWLIKLVFNRVG